MIWFWDKEQDTSGNIQRDKEMEKQEKKWMKPFRSKTRGMLKMSKNKSAKKILVKQM
jgi:hypothetical protein